MKTADVPPVRPRPQAVWRALVFVALLACAGWAAAYNLTPIYEETEDKLDGADGTELPQFLRPLASVVLLNFSDPVHEALAARIFGCKDSFENCGDNPERYVPAGVLDGLRWNDNPIFQISTQSAFCPNGHGKPVSVDLDTEPVCWLTLFRDAETKASAQPGAKFSGAPGSTPVALIYRIHFGDLQFIHGMGSWDGETAEVTQRHLLAWMEFTWKVHDGELGNLDAPIASLIPALNEVFGANGFSARSLFNPQASHPSPANDSNVRNMALGSLLHALEDSYSAAHTDREDASAGRSCPGFPGAPVPGRIAMFYAYNHQDGSKHKERDASTAAEAQLASKGSVVEVGQQLLTFVSQGKTWAEVAPYVACVMEVADPKVAAGPGPYKL